MNLFGVLITVKRISSVIFLLCFSCFRQCITVAERSNASLERLSSFLIKMYIPPILSENTNLFPFDRTCGGTEENLKMKFNSLVLRDACPMW